MFLGTSLVTKESSIAEDKKDLLLAHPYLTSENLPHPMMLALQDHFIREKPQSEFDSIVLSLLDDEGFDYTNKCIEYWFQKHDSSMLISLEPHCDYNFIYREKMKLEGDDWPHKVDKSKIVSPITIAVYLEVSPDMKGGELCISHRTWYEDAEPANITGEFVKQFPYDTICPKQSQILYFRGSEHYHWVNPVTCGKRKSMLINFWPTDL